MITVQDELIARLELTNKKELARIRSAMLETFGTPNGRIALQVILTILRMFREASNEEERILQNAARRILYLLGTGKEEDWIEALLQVSRKTLGGKK